MLQKYDFENMIDGWCLRFKQECLEKRLKKANEKHIQGWNKFKIIIVVIILCIDVGMGYLAYEHYNNNEMEQFWAAVIVTIIGDLGILIEFIIVNFEALRPLRSFAFTLACHFASMFYACNILPIPGILPGYLII